MARVLVDNQNSWEIWSVGQFTNCASGPKWVSGSFRIHLQNQFKTLSDGSAISTNHFNVADGRLVDESGTEWVFSRVGNVKQYYLSNGNYVSTTEDAFRLISPGNEDNYTLKLVMNISWDGTNFVVTSAVAEVCTG